MKLDEQDVGGGTRLREIGSLSSLSKTHMIFDWKGHGRINEMLAKFQEKFHYRPKTILYRRDAYFIVTNVPVVEN